MSEEGPKEPRPAADEAAEAEETPVEAPVGGNGVEAADVEAAGDEGADSPEPAVTEAESDAEADRPEPDETATLKAEVGELKDQLLRALAETENLRRRGQREREDLSRYGAAALARDLLAVADNLRRALDSLGSDPVEGDERLKTLMEGVQLTERELLSVFEKHHIAKLDPLGEKLDPHRHEAMFEMPAPEQANGTVVQVVQSGYLLHDRLLRPARVGVAKNPAKPAPANGEDETKLGGKVDTSA